MNIHVSPGFLHFLIVFNPRLGTPIGYSFITLYLSLVHRMSLILIGSQTLGQSELAIESSRKIH